MYKILIVITHDAWWARTPGSWESRLGADKNQTISIRLSIARHGRAGWQWTMSLAGQGLEGDAMAEFRSDEDGCGTWMRMSGDADWVMVTPPDERSYPMDETAARAEITEVCIGAASELVRRAPGGGVRLVARVDTSDPRTRDLALMAPMGTC